MEKIETSKKLLAISYGLAGILSVATIVATFSNYDTSGLTVVASAAWVQAAADATVYSLKAKYENRLKILLSMIKELSESKKFAPEIIVELFNGVAQGE